MCRITKRMLLSIIKHFPFEAVVVPSRFATDREEDIPGFIGALTDALKTALLESAPGHLSPRKLIEPSSHVAYEPATPTPTWTSMSLTQDPTLKCIDLESADEPVKLRKAALRNMALAGFPLRRISDLLLVDERPSSPNVPPPDLPFYSKLKPISPARRALMRDLMEETRRTLHYNPYAFVDLGKDPILSFPWSM